MIVARTGARYMPPTPFRAPRDPMASTWPCLLCTFTLWHLLLIRLCSQMPPPPHSLHSLLRRRLCSHCPGFSSRLYVLT